MDKVGANRRRITFEGTYNESAAWSPRGDRIAYVSRAERLFTIFVLAPDGSERQQVTFAQDRDNEDPSWAPGRATPGCQQQPDRLYQSLGHRR